MSAMDHAGRDGAASVRHLDALVEALRRFGGQAGRIERWSRHLAEVLSRDGRLLACGNGGSAAQAQHLTAELVGRYRTERRALAAIPLHADTSTTTAIANDYGADEVYARQVRAHGRVGDVLICLSTSGNSPNVVAAADAGGECGLTVWGLTGPAPNALTTRCDDVIAVEAAETATIQEVHLAALHMLCAGVDAVLTAEIPT